MMKEKVIMHYICFLSNVDFSILNLKLDHNFRIGFWSEAAFYRFLHSIEELPSAEIFVKGRNYKCINYEENKVFYIENSFEVEAEKSKDGKFMNMGEKFIPFYKELIQPYLTPVLRLIRLFKEGNICSPLAYDYFEIERKPQRLMVSLRYPFIEDESFKLTNEEMAELQSFLSKVKLPFKYNYLKVALENFEMSYSIEDIGLKFISLMICLEVLFSLREKLKYRISRSVAVLLGNNKTESENIFTEIGKLYNLRSKIVHTGVKEVTQDHVKRLRYYIRECIKKVHMMDIEKKDLAGFLNFKGY